MLRTDRTQATVTGPCARQMLWAAPAACSGLPAAACPCWRTLGHRSGARAAPAALHAAGHVIAREACTACSRSGGHLHTPSARWAACSVLPRSGRRRTLNKARGEGRLVAGKEHVRRVPHDERVIVGIGVGRQGVRRGRNQVAPMQDTLQHIQPLVLRGVPTGTWKASLTAWVQDAAAGLLRMRLPGHGGSAAGPKVVPVKNGRLGLACRCHPGSAPRCPGR